MNAKQFAASLRSRYPTQSIELIQDAEKAVSRYSDQERMAIMETLLEQHAGDFFPKKHAILQAARETVGSGGQDGEHYFTCPTCKIILPKEPMAWQRQENGRTVTHRCPRCGDARHWTVIVAMNPIDWARHNREAGYDGGPRYTPEQHRHVRPEVAGFAANLMRHLVSQETRFREAAKADPGLIPWAEQIADAMPNGRGHAGAGRAGAAESGDTTRGTDTRKIAMTAAGPQMAGVL